MTSSSSTEVVVYAQGSGIERLNDFVGSIMTMSIPPDSTTSLDTGGSAAMSAAVRAMADGSPAAIELLRTAAQQGAALTVTFPPAVRRGLLDGTLKLMSTSTGAAPMAVNVASGQIASHARVVGGAASGAVGGVALTATAAALLPLAIAGAAAYAQQAQLEKSLASLQAAVDRIEARLEDSDHGVCDAAEAFLETAAHATRFGCLPPYLRLELAAQRTRVEALYGSRRRFVRRFKDQLEKEQISFEAKKGQRQAWTDAIEKLARDGKLEEELTLFVRALLCQTKLDALAATCLVEEGSPEVALKLLDESAKELRSEFFDLHNRLRPLAATAPTQGLKGSILDKMPLVGTRSDQAHELVSSLVDQLDKHVLPGIPNPYIETPIEVHLSSAQVAELAAPLRS